ncbi:interleukin-1 beta isoform X1 [Anas platyrhynchos]|uniref:interleukin-1 beta isoform X1 n=1 Tax=Anas platyrhynchos TaxID=8839 RepID=UPI0018D7899C|nr:interleukin-1 beta-like isoform X2 [Anas platyrhynchos]
MAFVPDLDVLEGGSLSEETFYGPDCLYPPKVTPGGACGTAARRHRGTAAPRRGIARRSPAAFCPQKLRLDSEAKHGQSRTTVDVQVTVTPGHGARRFRQAATLVVAATKMLRRPSHQDFADSDLGGFLEEIFEPVTFQRLESSYAGAPVYRYTRSQSFDIYDINHKCFMLDSPTQLVALHVQGPLASRKVRLNIALYRPHTRPGSAGAMGMPVALGIKGYKLYMSCVMSGSEPVLQLEEADVMRDIDSAELTRFIFYRLDSPAEGTTRFESAAFPGWFICTSRQSWQPVGITNQPDQVNIATYKLSGR